MGLSGMFSKWFGSSDSGGSKQGDPVEYQGYVIVPIPKRQDGQFLTAGVIRKRGNGALQEEPFIRADTHPSFEAACQHAVLKGQQIINEQGDRLFRTPSPPSQ